MRDIYETLRTTKYFVDNEYLKKYSQVIERNTRTKMMPRFTHKHHIVPKCWYKLMRLEIDNSFTNLVNLSQREHFLAHYYLCLCTDDPFKYANELALVCLKNTKHNIQEQELLQLLPLYNNIYEDYSNKLRSRYKLYGRNDS